MDFDYDALFVGVQSKATMVTTAVPDGSNGHSNVLQSDRKYSIAHCWHCILFLTMKIMVAQLNAVQSDVLFFKMVIMVAQWCVDAHHCHSDNDGFFFNGG